MRRRGEGGEESGGRRGEGDGRRGRRVMGGRTVEEKVLLINAFTSIPHEVKIVPSPFPLRMLRTGTAGGTNGLGSE